MDQNFKFFEENRDSFVKEHKGEYALVAGAKVIGFFSDEAAALAAARDHSLKLGEFLVQPCVSKESDTRHFFTRVSFA